MGRLVQLCPIHISQITFKACAVVERSGLPRSHVRDENNIHEEALELEHFYDMISSFTVQIWCETFICAQFQMNFFRGIALVSDQPIQISLEPSRPLSHCKNLSRSAQTTLLPKTRPQSRTLPRYSSK